MKKAALKNVCTSHSELPRYFEFADSPYRQAVYADWLIPIKVDFISHHVCLVNKT